MFLKGFIPSSSTWPAREMDASACTLGLAHRRLRTSRLKQKRQQRDLFWFTDQTVKEIKARSSPK